MPEIRIPPVLRPDAEGARTFPTEAETVRDALDALVARFPALRNRVLEGDGVPAFLNVFVDGEDMRLAQGLDTQVAPTATILLLPAVAGGCYRPPMPAMAPTKLFLTVIACAQRA